MRLPIYLATLLVLATSVVPAVAAQGAVTYTLVIASGGSEVGQESIRLEPASAGSGTTTLTGIARYPALRARVQLTGVIERSGGGTLTAAQFDLQTPEHAWRTYVQAAARRLTVRTATEGRESAREFPFGPRTVVVDDSLFAPWLAVAALAGEHPVSVPAVWPRTGKRGTLTLERTTTSSGETVIRVTGDASVEVEFERNGRLARIILPTRDLAATVSGP
ncbi:MAG TPA: hypothetical protein VFI39_02920 [Gemmatimonadales bacterium]|nr:hypothetical protein [Gemmatimonadales bacterium]